MLNFAEQLKQFGMLTEGMEQSQLISFFRARFIELADDKRQQWLQLLDLKNETGETVPDERCAADPDTLFAEGADILDFIHEGECRFHGTVEYGDSLSGWDDTEQFTYDDPQGISTKVTRVYGLAEQLAAMGCHDRAMILLLQLIDCCFSADIEDYDTVELSFEEACDEGIFPFKPRKIEETVLLNAFLAYDGGARYEAIYQVYRRFPYYLTDIENLFRKQDYSWRDAEIFIDGWLDYVGFKREPLAERLLQGYCEKHLNTEAKLSAANRFLEPHPAFALNTVRSLFWTVDRQLIADFVKDAFDRLDSDLTILADFAEVGAAAAMDLKQTSLLQNFLSEAFVHDPTPARYLCLFAPSDGDRTGCWREQAWSRYTALPIVKAERNRWYVPDMVQFSAGTRTRALDRLTDAEIRFFKGDLNATLQRVQSDRMLGWSNNLLGMVVSSLVLLLHPAPGESKASRCLIQSLAARLGWQSEPFDYFEVFENYRVHMQTQSGWKQAIPKIECFLRQQIADRTEALLDGKYRKSYHKAAELIVGFGEYLESKSEREGTEYIDAFERQYVRFSSFRAALNLVR